MEKEQFKIKILPSTISSLLNDDIDQQILSPLSCLREFETNWLLEFDLPMVNKKDIKITLDENSISVEAKLKETYLEEKLGVKQNLNISKKLLLFLEKLIVRKHLPNLTRGD